MSVSHSFSDKVAAYLGGDPNAVYAALSRWAPFEGSNAKYNPLATTQSAPNVTDFNSAGVKNYPSEEAGAYATAVTLENGFYPDLLNWVKTGSQGNVSGIEQQLRKWGTTDFADVFASGGTAGGVGIGGEAGGGITFPTGGIFGDILDGAGNIIGKAKDFADFANRNDPTYKYFVDAGGNVVDKAGTIAGHITNAATSTADAIGNLASSLAPIKDAFTWLLDPHHWFRLFFIMSGVGLIVIGGYIYVRGDKAIGDVDKAAQLGAMGAA